MRLGTLTLHEAGIQNYNLVAPTGVHIRTDTTLARATSSWIRFEDASNRAYDNLDAVRPVKPYALVLSLRNDF